MLFLMNNKKELIQTGSKRRIYKYETGVDNIKILIPQNYDNIMMEGLSCIIQCVINPEDSSIAKIGMYKYCEYGELYKDRLTIEVPITSTITKNTGTVDIWLMFLKANEENAKYADYVLKTESTNFQVEDNGSMDTLSETSFDEIWEHSGLDEIQNEVVALSENKADNIEIASGTVVLKSGEKVLGSIDLPDDVVWKEWS